MKTPIAVAMMREKIYEIDSIFGNRASQFNLKVTELTYHFSALDPNNNFETPTGYFSGRDFMKKGLLGAAYMMALFN